MKFCANSRLQVVIETENGGDNQRFGKKESQAGSDLLSGGVLDRLFDILVPLIKLLNIYIG